MKTTLAFLLAVLPTTTVPALAGTIYTTGNLVVSVEGKAGGPGTYTDNQAAPLTLFQFQPIGTPTTTSSVQFVNSLTLPQTNFGSNFAVSGEYGSSSEGTLQLSGNKGYLTIMGYGVNAATFNANPAGFSTSGNPALAQSGSLTGQSYTAVPRVVALVDSNGNVISSTALYNVFDTNNPRSAYTTDGTHIYVSGQGNGSDHTAGTFYTTLGSNSATSITGDDTTSKTLSQDTRIVQVFNNTLYVSTDTKVGTGSNRDFIGTLGAVGTPPTTLANSSNGPARLSGFGNSGGTGKVTLTADQSNGINAAGKEINLSPEGYFFANATTLYVADSGLPKNDSVTNDGAIGSTLGAGGLQKWTLSGGTWTFDYTISAGLGLVANTSASGTTGLLGLTGAVVGDSVQLFATNFTIGDLDPTFLYGLTDTLSATLKPGGETFLQLAQAPTDSNFKGVAFAPSDVPEPATLSLAGLGIGVLVWFRRRSIP